MIAPYSSSNEKRALAELLVDLCSLRPSRDAHDLNIVQHESIVRESILQIPSLALSFGPVDPTDGGELIQGPGSTLNTLLQATVEVFHSAALSCSPSEAEGESELVDDACRAIGTMIQMQVMSAGSAGKAKVCVDFLREQLVRLQGTPSGVSAEVCLAALSLMKHCLRQRSEQEEQSLQDELLLVPFIESNMSHTDFSVQQVRLVDSPNESWV